MSQSWGTTDGKLPGTLENDGVGRLHRALTGLMETPLDAALATGGDPAEAAVALFRATAERVPAYRDWLDERSFDPKTVRTRDDFASVPVMTKQNYVARYPLAARCRDGRLEGCDMVAVSSGSTGTPTFWPRALCDEMLVARRFEQVFVDAFRADQKKTLAVVCFALGTWVGGMYTTNACRLVAARGHPVTVITPGNARDEILRVLRELSPSFDQSVLLGYPPFLKDVIDTGRARGEDFAAMRLHF